MQILDDQLRGWIDRKMVEYLGESEDALTQFVLSKLRARCAPGDLLAELLPVLDDDAEPFVLKLWRMLIFLALKAVSE